MKRFLFGLIALALAAIPAGAGDLIYFVKNGADRLCGTELECFAFDATKVGGLVTVRDTTTPANNLSNVPFNGYTFDDTKLAAITGSNLTNSAGMKFVNWPTTPYVRGSPQNLEIQSQTLGTSWAPARATVSSDATTAPDGTSTADKLIEDATAANSHYLVSSKGLTVGFVYNTSIYVKSGSANRYVQLTGAGISNASETPTFNVDTPAINYGATSDLVKSCAQTSVGSGWYRLSCVVIPTTTGAFIWGLADDSATVTQDTYNGDNASFVYLWGAQTSRGPLLHPYHATVAAVWNGIPQGYDLIGAKYGLQSEFSATNLSLQSENLGTTWANTRSSETLNGVTAPDGVATADVIVEDNTAGASHYMQQNITISSGTTYTVSAYIHAGTSGTRNFQLRFFRSDFAGSVDCGIVDPDDGSIASAASTNGAGGTLVDSGVETIGGGWFRYWCSGSLNTTTSSLQLVLYSGTSVTYNGDNASNVALWGISLANGPYPSSYIPTVTSSVARSADVISVTTASIGMADPPITAYADWMNRSGTGDRAVFDYFKDASNRLGIIGAGGGNMLAISRNGGTNTFIDTGDLWPAKTRNQAAAAFATGDQDLSFQGAAADTAAGTETTAYVTLELGDDANSAGLDGFLYRFLIVPRQVETDGGNLEVWRYNN